ncbi:response regulator transcription factor [Salinicoccus roseus]|uniref:response regulator transcription factor n=1 Tax=Salinicoccus roseus TaxID=45670 RepID=UPI003563B583
MKKVLLIDDEERMLGLLSLYLEPYQYDCKKALGAKEGLTYIKEERFDIVLLDIMMPEVDGWQACREIRKYSDVPIIMVTAREQKEDTVKGLRLGADDYVTKPFDEAELIARIEALLRRTQTGSQIEIGGLSWNEDRFELAYKGRYIKLTPKEFALVGLFIKNPDRVFTRNQLIDLIWGMDSETEGRTVDSHVRNMREKIRESVFPIDECFHTVWGVGYKWIRK